MTHERVDTGLRACEIISQRKSGLTQKAIAELHGISATRVAQILAKHGLAPPLTVRGDNPAGPFDPYYRPRRRRRRW
jgi:hypothetical protein